MNYTCRITNEERKVYEGLRKRCLVGKRIICNQFHEHLAKQIFREEMEELDLSSMILPPTSNLLNCLGERE
jgi:hypothetical protein